MADRDTRRAYNVLLGYQRPTFTMYPLFTGGIMTAGIPLTPGAGVWGALADILNPAGGGAPVIATEFWLIQANFTLAAGAFALHEVRVVNMTIATCVYQCRVDPAAASPNVTPFRLPIPIRCNPLANIQAQCIAANAADKISISLLVATGM